MPVRRSRVCVCNADEAWVCKSPVKGGPRTFAFIHYLVHAETMKHKPDRVSPAVSQSEPLTLHKHTISRPPALKAAGRHKQWRCFRRTEDAFVSDHIYCSEQTSESEGVRSHTISHGNTILDYEIGVELTSLFLLLGKRVKLPAQRFSPFAYFCVGTKEKRSPPRIKLSAMFKYVQDLVCTKKTCVRCLMSVFHLFCFSCVFFHVHCLRCH